MILKLYSTYNNNIEYCYYIDYNKRIHPTHIEKLKNILNAPNTNTISQDLIEIGPKLTFTTSWSTNVTNILNTIGININRIERSTRSINELPYDKMTEDVYKEPLLTFDSLKMIKSPYKVKNMGKFNKDYKLSLDEHDIKYYTKLFKDKYKRLPLNTELFDLAQSNCEHSRHYFFGGNFTIDGKVQSKTPFELVKSTLQKNPNNSLVAFSDDSSAIKGYNLSNYIIPDANNKYDPCDRLVHPIFTAETHNFPTSICPFSGAATGTGGRIRDVQAMGRGGIVMAGTAGYCVGDIKDEHARNILTEASNGASFYGNNFGEPVINGFTRSFKMTVGKELREWRKCIMFSGGIGSIDDTNLYPKDIENDLLVVKIGGPAYRIGIGGGAISSLEQTNDTGDYNAVQRADPEMEQKMNRVVRACEELRLNNPIYNIHDQGAGGNGNVLKELVYPNGGYIDLSKISKGDSTLSSLEIWNAEYQESNALLIHEKDKQLMEDICERENVCVDFVGQVNDSGMIKVVNGMEEVMDLNLEDILGKLPSKNYNVYTKIDYMKYVVPNIRSNVYNNLVNVLSNLDVGSKRFLTNKVDRSVTGLIAQQQCVGPFHTPLSDYSVVALNYNSYEGIASSIGEQPIKGLIDTWNMSKLTVAEMLTNLMWVKISKFEDIKCSANWMWAAKEPGESALLYNAIKSLSETLIELGIAIDGGKDSLSMVATHNGKKVKSPGNLVLSSYVTVPDIRVKVTPDFKRENSNILYIKLDEEYNLGGSCLYKLYGQLGTECPHVNIKRLKNLFIIMQHFIENNMILSGHDISDGGMLTCVLEMAFAGNIGFDMDIYVRGVGNMSLFFNEEPGVIIEVNDKNLDNVIKILEKNKLIVHNLGRTNDSKTVDIKSYNYQIIDSKLSDLRMIWERTSFDMELYQTDKNCVEQEKNKLMTRVNPKYVLNHGSLNNNITIHPKIAILRAEGSNGDREMANAFYKVGFDVYDVTMTDLLSCRHNLLDFSGVAFVGGFSYMDTLDAGKGWATLIKETPILLEQFNDFYEKEDTFSLGICNGAQLMGLLGWIKGTFKQNKSKRFESRWSTVKINKTPAIMLNGMEGSIIGVWTAHGEGQIDHVDDMSLCGVQYVDDNNNVTEEYPDNPNGSINGCTGICNKDGRHLAMMPHPERCYLDWQLPYNPDNWDTSPWLRMFENAYKFCVK